MGDQTQFVAALTQNQNRLYAFILSLVGNPAAAEDLLQTTNLVLWKKWTAWDAETNFAHWAMAVARFEVLNWRRRAANDRLVFSAETLDLLATEREAEDSRFAPREDALVDCLEELTPRHRDLLDQRYANDASVQSIAEQAGLAPNAVTQALFRAREALAKCMRRKLAEETS